MAPSPSRSTRLPEAVDRRTGTPEEEGSGAPNAPKNIRSGHVPTSIPAARLGLKQPPCTSVHGGALVEAGACHPRIGSSARYGVEAALSQ
jgi:hypothetical protein